MNSKEISVESRQNNAKVLTEIKDNLKKSLSAWESFLNLVEIILIKDEDWAMAEEVSGPVAEALRKIGQTLQDCKDKEPVKKVSPGDLSTILEVCSVCRLSINSKDVDWKFMKETNTWQVVCKDCAKIFNNHRGDK